VAATGFRGWGPVGGQCKVGGGKFYLAQ